MRSASWSRLTVQLEWIREDQTERLDDHTFRLLHFPPLPPLFGDYYSDEPPEASLSAFKLKNPDFPSSISDEEILQRYISNRLPNSIVWEVNVLSWIPETGEVIQTTHQHDLFQRIWDGRQRYSIEEPPDEEFQYWIDFENQTLEAEGYLDWEYHSVIRLPFNDLKVGILEETAKRNAEDRTRARERRQAEEQLDARVNSVKSSGA